MSNTYKMVTLIGTSPESYETAIDNALSDLCSQKRCRDEYQ